MRAVLSHQVLVWPSSYLLAQQFPHCISELRCAYGSISICVKLRTAHNRNKE